MLIILTLYILLAWLLFSQLDYKGKHVRIEGGISHTFDFQMLTRGLNDALQATLTDAAKFDRLAARLKASSADAKGILRKRIEDEAVRVHEYATRTSVSPYPWGPGRIDALIMIQNRQMASLTDIPENIATPIAPTKPPFLWNAPQGLWTQWAGIVKDPLNRNLGETVGVFLPVDLTSKSPEEGLFESAAADTHERGLQMLQKTSAQDVTRHNGKYISYLRVSTAKQGQSGLGLEAQRAAVESFLRGIKHEHVKQRLPSCQHAT